MVRKTRPVVDKRGLATVLRSIAKNRELRKEFSFRGSASNPIRLRGGDRAVNLRVSEIISCIGLDGDWAPGDESLEPLVNRVVYRHLNEKWGVDAIAEELTSRCQTDVFAHKVAIEITGLGGMESPLPVGNVTFGQLDHFAATHKLETRPDLWAKGLAGTKDLVVAFLEVEAPTPNHVHRIALREVERALDALASVFLRRMFDTGPPWELHVGKWMWRWPVESDADDEGSFGFHNPWMRGFLFEIDRKTLLPQERPRLQAEAFPWIGLPEGEVRRTLQQAYETMGSAVRHAPRARTSIALAWTAIETTLAPQVDGILLGGDRAARAIATRLLLAVATGGGTTEPTALANFYLRRNRVVHEAYDAHWDEKEASRKLTDLYHHLDEFASFCVERNAVTWNDVLGPLNDPKVRAKTAGWAKQWREDPAWTRDHAVLEGVRGQAARSAKLWDGVIQALEPRPPKSKPLLPRLLTWLRRRLRTR